REGVGGGGGGEEVVGGVEEVLVAVEDRRRTDAGRVRAGVRLGDRHRRPERAELLLLLRCAHGGDGGVAEPLSREREQKTDVAPAHLGDAEDRREVRAVLDPALVSLVVTVLGVGPSYAA